MAMLAEPRRKQKWTLNPRGKHWSDDSNKFGQKMLEKMGWSSGKGLGANLDGMTEHIRAKYKADQAGVGFSDADRDKQWTQHQEGFNELLQKLQNGDEETAPTPDNELSGKSLELKSKQSRARVHYQKFTRGKDVNKYSAKDLANIFGKKNLDDKPQESINATEMKQDPVEAAAQPIGSCDSSHGVVTIKGGSISDYFKNKMSVLSRKVTSEVTTRETDSETETHVGFGFSNFPKKSVTPTKKSSETNYSFVNPAMDITSPNDEIITPGKRKNDFAFENPCLDVASPKIHDVTPRKRKNAFAFDNSALELGDVVDEPIHTPKKRRSESAFEIGGLDDEHAQNGGPTGAISRNADATKKKRKTKAKECIPQPVDGIVNEALNLESRDAEIPTSNQFEVPRIRSGLANDALDLTDETNGKKRVTFNEAVEYDTDLSSEKRKKKKNKMAGKLDKFEVDNEKLKRKKKKSRNEAIGDSAFVNVAMDVDTCSQEANENAANERKSERARKKRDRRVPNLETIEEVPDEDVEATVIEVVTLDESLVGEANDDFEVMSLNSTEKKKNKKKKRRDVERIDEIVENGSMKMEIKQEDVELVEEIVSLDRENSGEILENSNAFQDTDDNVRQSKRKKKKKTKKEKKDSMDDEPEVTSVDDSERTKKDRTMRKTTIDDSKENVDTENFVASMEIVEEVESAKKTKKRRKDGKNGGSEDAILKTRVDDDDDDKVVDEVVENGVQSPWNDRLQKSRKSFKALFAKSPIVNFVGSNINEIRGYGMDLK